MSSATLISQKSAEGNSTQRFFQSEHVRLAYRYYSSARPNARTLLCVHGFERTSRDFIPLAALMSEHCNVVCPDLPGRGDSSWFVDKMRYRPETYAPLMAEFIDHLGCGTVDYFGTSVGGVVGLLLASHTALVDRIIINDIGPYTPQALVRALGKAIRARKRAFPSFAAADAYTRRVNATFGPMTDEEWQYCTESCIRQTADGSFVSDHDPDICVPWEADDIHDRDLWPNWAALKCPALLIRGATSTVLRGEDAARMVSSNRQATLVEIPEVGHAPMFYAADKIDLIAKWLHPARGQVSENGGTAGDRRRDGRFAELAAAE